MIYIYYTVLKTEIDSSKWTKLIQKMPPDIQKRIERYKKWDNKQQLVVGRALLRKILCDMGYSNFDLSQLQYDEFNKPFWKKSIHFSIAHSKNIVGCAVAQNTRIGLDIEYIRPIQPDNFKHILNQKDRELLQQSTDSQQTFFTLWTIKEAVSKADGRGLNMDVRNVYIDEEFAIANEERWNYFSLPMPDDFSCHYVLEADIKEIPIIKKIVALL